MDTSAAFASFVWDQAKSALAAFIWRIDTFGIDISTLRCDTFGIDSFLRPISTRRWSERQAVLPAYGFAGDQTMNQLSHSVGNYRVIRERIIAVDAAIDDMTLADTLEGLTDLPEILAAVVRSALVDEAMVVGLKGHIQALQERLERLAHRAAERRRISRDAMSEVAIKKITAPDFTVSLRPGPPALVVVDESTIPAPYWEPREPKLNKLSLIADLKVGASIPGVHLSNPEMTLSVRVR